MKRFNGIIAGWALGIAAACSVGCGGGEAESAHAHELPRVGLTAWTAGLEFFVDFEAPVAGEPVGFVLHVSALNPHVPLDSARLGGIKVDLIDGNGAAVQLTGLPVKAGMWKGEWTPPRAGVWRMRAELGADRAELGHVQVSADGDAAAHLEVPTSEVTLSKEAAWAMPFGLGTAGPDTVYSGLRLAGRWKEAPGRAVDVVAPVAGVVASAGAVEGMAVSEGQTLFKIQPEGTSQTGVHSEWASASAELEAAEAALRRIEPLAGRGTATRAELEEARLRRTLAVQSVQRLEPFRPGSGGTPAKAPLSGTLGHVGARPGSWVAAGTTLATVSSGGARFVEVAVPVDAADEVRAGRGAWVQGEQGVWSAARLVACGVVAEEGRVMALFEVEGKGGTAGGFTDVHLRYGGEAVACAVPESALLEQYGTWQVVVAESGEGYRIVPVQIGRKTGGRVEITAGLSAGERIVTQGAYAVRMVAMAGSTPAHGHSH